MRNLSSTGAGRVLVNALSILVAYEVAVAVDAAARIVTGSSLPVPLLEFAPLVIAFHLARWVFVLPGLLAVLIGIELIARRTPHARSLTVAVALIPMVSWALTSASDGSSADYVAILGVTAVVFALVARLPDRAAIRARHEPAEATAAPS